MWVVRSAIGAGACWLLVAASAGAQPVSDLPPPAVPASGNGTTTTRFLSRFEFRLGLEALASRDPRFDWDADFGANVDLLQFPRGRLTFLANYEATLGGELQPFDPIQGNYTLAGALAWRTRYGEVAALLHHVSRHLGDRPKPSPVDWNLLGVRWQGAAELGRAEPVRLEARVMAGGVVNRSFVDYRWQVTWGGAVRQRLGGRISGFGAGDVTLVATAGPAGAGRLRDTAGAADRGILTGAHLEGGIRIDGVGGGLELFAGVERRIDAHPLDRLARSWLVVGFRVVGP